MKAVIGFLFFLLFLSGFALLSLQGRQLAVGDRPASDDPLTAGRWQALRVFGNTVPVEADVHLRFADNGRLQGSTGCNRISGRYERAESGFRIASLRSTRRACPDRLTTLEGNVFEVLRKARTLRIVEGELKLYDAGGEWLSTFAPTDAGTARAESS